MTILNGCFIRIEYLLAYNLENILLLKQQHQIFQMFSLLKMNGSAKMCQTNRFNFKLNVPLSRRIDGTKFA